MKVKRCDIWMMIIYDHYAHCAKDKFYVCIVGNNVSINVLSGVKYVANATVIKTSTRSMHHRHREWQLATSGPRDCPISLHPEFTVRSNWSSSVCASDSLGPS